MEYPASAQPPAAAAITKTSYGDIGCLTHDALDPAAIEASVRNASAGAVVTFVGYTRDEFQGKKVTRLDYEAYSPLALKTLHAILLEARQLPTPLPLEPTTCFDHVDTHDTSLTTVSSSPPTIELTHLGVYHLLGSSPVLTPSIVIAVSSPHRREAFVACEWLLEQVKMRVQVWKREWYADGTTVEGQDGEGPHGSRSKVTKPVWKENFPKATIKALKAQERT